MPANFNTPDKYDWKKSFSRIVFGDDAYLMEVELNELQKIMDEKVRLTSSSLLTDGFISPTPLRTEGNNIVLPTSRIVINGRVLTTGMDMTISVASGDNVYLAVWDQQVTYQEQLPEYGNMSGGKTITNNGILDTRAGSEGGEETTRRIQTRFQLVKETGDNTKTYLEVAIVGTPIQTSTLTDRRISSAIKVSSSDMNAMFGKELLKEFKSKSGYVNNLEIVESPKRSLLDVTGLRGRTLVNLVPTAIDYPIIDGLVPITPTVQSYWRLTKDDVYTNVGTLTNTTTASQGRSALSVRTEADTPAHLQPINSRNVRYPVYAKKDDTFIIIADVLLSNIDSPGAISNCFSESGITLSSTIISTAKSKLYSPAITLLKVQTAPTTGGIISPVVTFLEGAVSTYYVDAFRMYRITEEEYQRINKDYQDGLISDLPTQIANMYPWVNGIAGVENPMIVRRGKNLLPGFLEWFKTVPATPLADDPYKVFSNSQIMYYQTNVPPGTYTFKINKTAAQLKINLLDSAGMNVPTTNPLVNTESYINDSVVTFTVTSDVVKVKVSISIPSGVVQEEISNPFLYMGDDVNTPFVPKEDSSQLFQTELYSSIDGNVADKIYEKNGKYYKLKTWNKFVVSGKDKVAYNTKSSANSHVITIFGITRGNSSNELYARNSEGLILSSEYYAANVLPANIAYLTTDGSDTNLSRLILSIDYVDSGWGPDYTPTPDEINAYLLGWKMCAGWSDVPYNATRWHSKVWIRANVAFADAKQSDGTLMTTVPKESYPGFRPMEIVYRLLAPIFEEIKTTGSVLLEEGKNIISYLSGVVLREKANPKTDAIYWIINYGSLAGSVLKFRTKEVLQVYRGDFPDNRWFNSAVSGSNAPAPYYTRLAVANFDPTEEYFVDYIKEDNFPVPVVNGILFANEKAQITGLMDKTNQAVAIASEALNVTKEINQRAEKVIDKEFGNVPTFTSKTVREGLYLVEANQPSELDITVYGEVQDNLLRSYGNFEDDSNADGLADGWINLNGTGTFSRMYPGLDGYGAYAQQLTSSPTTPMIIGSGKTTLLAGRKYVVIANALTDGTAPAYMSLYKDNSNAENEIGVTAQSTVKGVHYILHSPDVDIEAIVYLYKGYYSSSNQSGWVAFDGVGIYEVSDVLYNRIGKDITKNNIREFLPHVDERQYVKGVLVSKEGRNLLPPFADWASASAAPSEYVLDYTNVSASEVDSIEIDVVPNTKYIVRVEVDGGVTGRWNITTIRNKLGTGVIGGTQTGTATVMFSSGNNTKLYLNMYVSVAGSNIKFKNWQLNLGEKLLPFEPNDPQRVLLPVTLGRLGDVKDKAFKRGSDWYYTENIKKSFPVNGEYAWSLTGTQVSGMKKVMFPIASLPGAKVNSTEFSGIRFDGKRLYGRYSLAEAGQEEEKNIASGTAGLQFNIPNTLSGWNDDLHPNTNVIRAFMYGWKALPYLVGGTYNSWVSLVDGSAPQTNTEAFVSTNKAPGWNAFAYIDYVLKDALTSPIPNAEGSISLHNGTNQISVKTGAVQREVVTPLAGLYMYANSDSSAASMFKNPALDIIAAYKNGIRDPKWRNQRRTSPSLSGIINAIQSTRDYDANSKYSFSYIAYNKDIITTKVEQVELMYRTDLVGSSLEDVVENVARLNQDSFLSRSNSSRLDDLDKIIPGVYPGTSNLLKNSTGLLGTKFWTFTYAAGWKPIARPGYAAQWSFINSDVTPLGSFSYISSDTIGYSTLEAGTYSLSVEMYAYEYTEGVLEVQVNNPTTGAIIASVRANPEYDTWRRYTVTFTKPKGAFIVRILNSVDRQAKTKGVRRIMISESPAPAPYNSDGDLLAMKPLIEAVTEVTSLYVNAATGNDTNLGISEALPFKTIQAALNSLPKIINNAVLIKVAAGTYTGFIMEDFSGTGFVQLYGVNQSTVIINSSCTIRNNLARVNINSMTMDSTLQSTMLSITNVTSIQVSYITFERRSVSNMCIDILTSTCFIGNCTWRNTVSWSVYIQDLSNVLSFNQTQTAVNSSGFVVRGGSCLRLGPTGQLGSTNSVTNGANVITNAT